MIRAWHKHRSATSSNTLLATNFLNPYLPRDALTVITVIDLGGDGRPKSRDIGC